MLAYPQYQLKTSRNLLQMIVGCCSSMRVRVWRRDSQGLPQKCGGCRLRSGGGRTGRWARAVEQMVEKMDYVMLQQLIEGWWVDE